MKTLKTKKIPKPFAKKNPKTFLNPFRKQKRGSQVGRRKDPKLLKAHDVSQRKSILGCLGGNGYFQRRSDGKRKLSDLLGSAAHPKSRGQVEGMDEEMDLGRKRKTKIKETKRCNMAQALIVARSSNFDAVVHKFKKQYFSESSRKSRESKREVVAELAKTVKGSNRFLPLNKDTVEGVSAAMREVGMKSGSQYLTELRLMHIEAGYEMHAWLERVFDLCKKGLEREKGPTKRAAAVKLEDVNWNQRDLKVHKKGWPIRPFRAFLWAAIWMLREIELRNMRTKHVKVRDSKKEVSIVLPLSKCDQQGEGVMRTLACCNHTPCKEWCPYALAKMILAERCRSDMLGLSWLFPSKWRQCTTKSGMIDSWKCNLGNEISGHSPRRSGAMHYVRAGLPIQELAFLGRWRSNVVLTYAEEALQETAVSFVDKSKTASPKDLTLQRSEIPSLVEDIMDKVKTEIEILRPKENQAAQQHEDLDISACFERPRFLWVRTKGRGLKHRPCHLVTKASWTLNVSNWSTACGWFFAEKPRDFNFVPVKPKDAEICSKCELLEKSATMSGREKGALTKECKSQIRLMPHGQVEGLEVCDKNTPDPSIQWKRMEGGRACHETMCSGLEANTFAQDHVT